MAPFGAIYDANVLYPSGLRNFLMHLGLVGIFSAHWSADIHEEWIPNLLQKRPDLTWEQLEHIRSLMDRALPNALVTGYEQLITRFRYRTPMIDMSLPLRFNAGQA